MDSSSPSDPAADQRRHSWRLPLAAAMLVLAAAIAIVVGPDRQATPGSSPAPSDAVSVLDTGAEPDDDRDDLEAFEAAVRRAAAQDRAVVVPSGTFLLSDVLTLDGVTMRGAGTDETRLVSTDPSAGSIDLTGEGATLTRLEHAVPGAEDRSPEPGRQNLNVRDATAFRVSDVHLVGARGAGILVRDSHGGVIEGSVVEQTLADGIHLTSGSSDVVVRDNLSRETGDDGIAVVSYERDDELTRRVRIEDNRVVRGQTRGISVVGGESVTITGNEVVESESGGIYIAAEREWETHGVRDVTVADNRVVGSPTRNSHASVLVYSSENAVDDVTFRGNTVVGSTTTGFGSWVHPDGSGEIGDLRFEDNRVEESAGSLWEPTRFEAGTLDGDGNTGF